MKTVQAKISRSAREQTPIIDCDIHNTVPSGKALEGHLSSRWRRHTEIVGSRTHSPYRTGHVYPKGSPGAARHDSWPPSGGPPGSSLEFMREQLLDAYNIKYGILSCLYGVSEQRNVEYGAALARAVNEWQITDWLEPEPRLRASIVIPLEAPKLAAQEIRNATCHPGFVQVLVFPRTRQPLGQQRYWPIYEAACETGQIVAMHFSTGTPTPTTSGGFPSFYIEDHTSVSIAFQAQLTSLIMEGVFERFPDLRFALIEGGFAWLPSLMARLDALYARLHEEVPHLKMQPSEYVRRNIRLTTQPIEEPPQPKQLVRLIEQVGTNMLMFSTDYPHWDFDDPGRAFQTRLPRNLEQQLYHENARSFYRLGA
jgi:uncharacterized protein